MTNMFGPTCYDRCVVNNKPVTAAAAAAVVVVVAAAAAAEIWEAVYYMSSTHV